MSQPKISVIIPVYNAEAYLAESLRSVQTQDLRDIEILCVDDCSTDGSHAMLEAFSREDFRIIPLRHEQNQRQGAARNTGMAAAKGDYVFFLDSDDFLAAPGALSVLYRAAKEDDVDEVIGRVLRWTPETDERKQNHHAAYQTAELRKTTILRNPELAWNMPSWNKLMRLDMLRRHNVVFDTRLLRYEDYDFSCRVHVFSRAISFIPHTTYIHRMRPDSTVHDAEKTDSIYHLLAAQNIISFLSQHDIQYSTIFKDRIIHYITLALKNSVKFDFDNNEQEQIIFMLKEIIDTSPPGFLPQNIILIDSFIKNSHPCYAYKRINDMFMAPQNKYLRDITENLREKNIDLQEMNTALRKSNAKLRDINDGLSGSNTRLRDVSGKLRKANTIVQESNSKLRESNGNLRDVNGKLRDANTKFQEMNGKLRESNTNIRDMNDKLRESNMKFRDTNDKLRTANTKFRDMCGELRKSNANLHEENKKLRDSNTRLRDASGKLRAANTKFRDMCGELRKSNAKYLASNNNLRELFQKIKKYGIQLKEKNKKLHDSNTRLRDANGKLRTANTKFRDMCGELRKSNAKYLASNNNLRELFQKIKKYGIQLKEKNKKLQQELKIVHDSIVWKITAPLRKKK